MTLRPRRRALVAWSSSDRNGTLRFTRPARSRRIRHDAMLALLGMIRIADIVRARWSMLAGGVLTVTGVVLRSGPASVVLLPGMLLLLVAVFSPPSPKAARRRRAELERELAAYSTPAQRSDLEATLDRYPDGITRELREILASQTGGRR